MGLLGNEIIKERIKDIFEEASYHEENISYASYDLRLDDEEIVINGKLYNRKNKYRYDETGGVIILPARKISIISTIEKFKLPNDLCARVGITFSLSRKGLVPLFGPQIDPGYPNKFYAVVYNASPHDIKLRKGDRILKMEIHSVEGKTPPYEEKPYDITQDIDLTKEDFVGDLLKRIEKIEKKYEGLDIELKENRAKVEEVSSGYKSVTYFGVFLVAASIFGVILVILLSAASYADLTSLLAKQLPLMILIIVITVFLIILTVTIAIRTMAQIGGNK